MPSMGHTYRWSLYSEQKVFFLKVDHEKSNTELELFELDHYDDNNDEDDVDNDNDGDD